jgi:hypothetical protein
VTTIYFIDSEKGGTGKSWLARTMHYLLAERGDKFVGIDADTANPTYYNIYSDVEKIPFSIDPQEEDFPDTIFDFAVGTERSAPKDVLISLPAQAHRAVSKWLLEKDVLTLAQENQVQIKKLWVSDGEEDSLQLFIKSVELYDDRLPHIFIKNFGRCTEWEYFDAHAAVQAAIHQYRVPVVDFPKLGDFRRIRMNAERLTFEAALNFNDFGLLGRRQILTYLISAKKALTAGGVFDPPIAASLPVNPAAQSGDGASAQLSSVSAGTVSEATDLSGGEKS